jgi:hypothetical protein
MRVAVNRPYIGGLSCERAIAADLISVPMIADLRTLRSFDSFDCFGASGGQR